MRMGNRKNCVLIAVAGFAALAGSAACKKKAQEEPPQVSTSLPIQRVVLYRNGVGYFERAGQVEGDEVRFAVRKSQVGDFLASLTVVGYLVLLPAYVRRRDVAYAIIAVSEIVVLVLAASGILSVGGH